MSFLTKYSIGGVYFRPTNADVIGFKMDWTGDAQEAELNTDKIVLETVAKELCVKHVATYGVFEGLPLTVEIGSLVLEYFIDFTDNPLFSGIGDSEIEVTIRRRKAVDYFKKQADGLSFEALNITNPISLIDVPYLIIPDNQAEMLIMLLISAFSLTKALIEAVKELVTAITDFVKIISIGLVVNTGQIISAVLLLIARIIYVAALLVALIDLTKKILELIFPPVRKLKASKIKELLEKGCSKLGYEFFSTIINALPQLTILPVPLREGQKSIFTNLFSTNNGSFTKGYPTARDTTPTLGSLFDAIEKMFNAKIRIVGDKVFFERRDFWKLISSSQVTTTLTLQSDRENRHRYNLGEAWKRYWIHMQTDPSDLNTLDQIDSTQVEYSTEPVNVVNADLVGIKGLVDVSLPWAFGIRKEELTAVEKAALPFAKLGDKVIDSLGGDSNLVSKIEGRIGNLQISQQYFTVSKLMFTVSGKQPANYLELLSAKKLYEDFHAINQVKENFKRVYDDPIRFSTDNYEDVIDNNFVVDQEGDDLEILTLSFVNEDKVAEITYARPSNEGNNTQTILING